MILVAMLVQSTHDALAAPWPLKIVIDNVVVGRKLEGVAPRACCSRCWCMATGSHLAEIAAAIAVIVIAILNASRVLRWPIT